MTASELYWIMHRFLQDVVLFSYRVRTRASIWSYMMDHHSAKWANKRISSSELCESARVGRWKYKCISVVLILSSLVLFQAKSSYNIKIAHKDTMSCRCHNVHIAYGLLLWKLRYSVNLFQSAIWIL